MIKIKDMPLHDKQKMKNTSELEDLEELAQFWKKKKNQNEALKKIIDKINNNKK